MLFGETNTKTGISMWVGFKPITNARTAFEALVKDAEYNLKVDRNGKLASASVSVVNRTGFTILEHGDHDIDEATDLAEGLILAKDDRIGSFDGKCGAIKVSLTEPKGWLFFGWHDTTP